MGFTVHPHEVLAGECRFCELGPSIAERTRDPGRRWAARMELWQLATVCLLASLCIIQVSEGAPANANFSSCRVHPDWGNCCTLKEMMRYPPVGVRTLEEYLKKNPIPRRKRFRPAAHLADDAYIEKYNRAMELLKSLPQDDPRSHSQQSNLHCMYGSPDVRSQLGYPDLDYQVHKTWFFLPFHRWFSFFHERILARLIDDDTFALPFWNWDSQSATKPYPNAFPLKMYGQPNKYPGLYDPRRNQKHCAVDDTIVDLDIRNVINDIPSADTVDDLREYNNALMWDIMVKNHTVGPLTPLWSEVYSPPIRAGDVKAALSGDLEANPHGAIHTWTGSREEPQWEDMGRGYSGARDPIFFAHHNNVDRLWNVWLKIPGKGHYDDPDYLDSEFLFYDENAELVKVTVGQALDFERFNYEYQAVDNTWLYYDPDKVPEIMQMVQERHSNGEQMSFAF